jgi:ribosome biogenesis GTPase
MHPILTLNKVDLPETRETARELTQLYGSIGYEVVAASAESGEGVDVFRALVCSGTSALIGPSGVGKSSLLNAVAPELDLRTGELSRKTGTGRHTTVGSRLLALECGGTVADTPGFGDVGLWGIGPEELADCFPEFAEPATRCRFRGCAHVEEPDCGVRAALEAGRIAASRYESYCTLRDEAGAIEGR